ncbi:methionine gamma-lyase [Pelomyxa schiedti]|nr:methionine gamma-lyase [Pelomyxa schiedti]
MAQKSGTPAKKARTTAVQDTTPKPTATASPTSTKVTTSSKPTDSVPPSATPVSAKATHTTGISTRCLHGDCHEDHVGHAHTYPIFQTSTFVFDSADHGADLFGGRAQGHIYSRIGNPTVQQFEKLVCTLEEGQHAVAFGSGMAAVTGALLPFLQSGDHVITGDTLYGPSTHVITNLFARYGIQSTIVDCANLEAVRAAVKPTTKVIYLETPANPTNKISDIAGVVAIAKGCGAIVVVDNTFSSPIFQKPIVLGADLALHSLTKYINGHGDVVGGVVITKTKEQGRLVQKYRQDTGGILGPMDAFLVLRGMRTLAIRMEKHCVNGLAVAKFLQSHPKIETVLHPGLEGAQGYELGRRQMTGYGGTFSFLVRGGFEPAKKLIESCKLCTLAVSLGTVDTLIEHPASMTHASVPEELMRKQGLTRNLVRISVGLEDPADIIADLTQALAQCP